MRKERRAYHSSRVEPPHRCLDGSALLERRATHLEVSRSQGLAPSHEALALTQGKKKSRAHASTNCSEIPHLTVMADGRDA